MLTVKKWNVFLLRYFLGFLVCFLPIIILSILFASRLNYMGEDTSPVLQMILQHQPFMFFWAVAKVIGAGFLFSVGLQFISSSFRFKYKFIFSFLFFLSTLVRLACLYPGVTESWLIVKNSENMRKAVQFISSLPLDSQLRQFIHWLPFVVCVIGFAINFVLHMRALIYQNRMVRKSHYSVYVDEFDQASRVFAIQGVSFLLFISCGSVFLSYLTSQFSVFLPQNSTHQSQPNIFIFAIDSLRADRVFDKKYKNVMPFLQTQMSHAALAKPMLVGIPRTFPSWVELATGKYAISTGVRTMFPARGSRLNKKNTIFERARSNGYSTIFVSDFAGDIFARYPFGGDEINAPTSNLKSLIENTTITLFSPIQSLLILPSLQRMLPSLLESAEIADPQLVAQAMADSLSHFSNAPKPVFMTTFFSSAHFPYAAPGPWYAKFQKKSQNELLSFRKIPDQIENKENRSTSISEEKKSQTIALYDGGLSAIDFTLEKVFLELEKKNWLQNAVVLIFGDHGENLYDSSFGMGHGDGVQGEYSGVTPLLIFNYGNKLRFSNQKSKNIVRSIDVAPTIASQLHINFDFNDIDGQSLFDNENKISKFPEKSAYMESGLWFIKNKLSPEAQPRVIYPGITALLDIDFGMDFEFYLRPNYSQTVIGVKERAWIDDKFRLVLRTTKYGVYPSLYSRSDKNALNNLLEVSQKNKYDPIYQNMLKNMNYFLTKRGVDVVPISKTSFFYSENIAQ